MFKYFSRWNSKRIYFPVFLLLALLLAGCDAEVKLLAFGSTLVYPCEKPVFTMVVDYEIQGDSDMFSEDFWDLDTNSEASEISCFWEPTIDCYKFWFKKHYRGVAQGFTCQNPSFRIYKCGFVGVYGCPSNYYKLDPYGKPRIIHEITCETSTPILGNMIYIDPPDHDDWRTPVFGPKYISWERIPTQIDLDAQTSPFHSPTGAGDGTLVKMTGSVLPAAGNPCPGFDIPPSGKIWYEKLEFTSILGGRHDYQYYGSNVFRILARGFFSSTPIIYPEITQYDIYLRYEGDFFYKPSNYSGTFQSHLCQQPQTSISFDSPPRGLPGQAIPVGVRVSGYGYDENCAKIDLEEGVAIVTTDEGRSCTLSFTDGYGICNVSFATAGTHTVKANYSGVGIFADGSATTTATLGQMISVTRIVGINPNPVIANSGLKVTVRVSGPGVTPVGHVQVTAGGGSCTAQLANGSGSCTLTPSQSGRLDITASYGGDTNYLPSSATVTSDNPNTIVSEQVSITKITSPDSGHYVTCSFPTPVEVTVTVSSASGTPTGIVAISGADNNCSIALSGGTGSCTVYFTQEGYDTNGLHRTIYATYQGDAHFKPSQDSVPVDVCD